MQTMFIKPGVPGAVLRDPDTGDLLPDEGASKPRNPFWLRLLNRGDVIEAKPAPKPNVKQSATDSKEA